MDASILTIGTELTTGEISNSNSQWLAEKLTALHLNVRYQQSVPDDEILVAHTLGFLAPKCNHIFVVGGLGPTPDDLTRSL